MKITFVIPYAGLSGGIRVVAIYAALLAERGHEVRVISRPARKAPIGRRIKDFLRGRKRAPLPSTPLLTGLGAHHKVLDRRRPVTAQDVEDGDVVIATWWDTAEAVAALPASKGRKFYLLQGYETFDHLPRDRVIATYHAGMHMLAVSDYIRKEIETHHAVSGIGLLPNGVDTDHFTAPPRAKNDTLTVGFLYQNLDIKNLPFTLEVLRRARQTLPDLRIRAFGKFAMNPADNLPEGIEYEQAPPQDRIPQIYAACDVWLFNSLKEGFGLPILEAMACRTPVLATPAGAAPQIIREGENGYLLPFDAGAFVTRLEALAAMPAAAWQELSQGAHATARQWNWSAACDRLEQIITEDVT